MNTTIKPFSSLDKSLRDTIIHKSVIKLNLGLFIQCVETSLNVETDVNILDQINNILESAIVDISNSITPPKPLCDECEN